MKGKWDSKFSIYCKFTPEWYGYDQMVEKSIIDLLLHIFGILFFFVIQATWHGIFLVKSFPKSWMKDTDGKRNGKKIEKYNQPNKWKLSTWWVQTAITFLVQVAQILCHRHSQTNWNFIQTCIVHSHIQNLIHSSSISLAQWRQCDGTRGCYVFNILCQVMELSEEW